jgi:tellurite resistance protein TehA-like permease
MAMHSYCYRNGGGTDRCGSALIRLFHLVRCLAKLYVTKITPIWWSVTFPASLMVKFDVIKPWAPSN